MAIDRVPVVKRCRSLGLEPAYIGSDKKASNRTTKKNTKKSSEYGIQLKEKQKAKFIYGVLEKQFRLYFEKASNMSGQAGENLLILLESRLDSVVFRMNLARTRREARQIVGHAHFTVNGKNVNIPSYLVKAGDVIQLKEKYKTNQLYKDILESTEGRIAPNWLDVDKENCKATVTALPTRDQIDVPVNEQAIVELYSK